jgi:phosphoribosylamine--glycine ligase
MGTSVKEATKNAYVAIDKIDWPNGFCRSDIAYRAIEREEGRGK